MKYYLSIILAYVFFSCTTLEEPPSSLVVEAYIYDNKPIENIKITLVNPINSEIAETPVSNADVSIITNGIRFTLKESAKPGFYELGSNLTAESGKTYTLKIKYGDIEMEGQTTVPNKILGLTSNEDSLLMNNPDHFLNVTWTGDIDLWYLGVITANNADSTDFPFNSFFSIPTQQALIKITPNDVQNTGSQNFVLYGITKDYEDLYRITNSSIGSTNAGNMTNGFGIFAGFSSDTLTFVATSN